MLMMVSVLVSAATIESAIAHQGMSRSGKKVVAKGALFLAEAQAKQSDSGQVERDDGEIEFVQAHCEVLHAAPEPDIPPKRSDNYQAEQEFARVRDCRRGERAVAHAVP